MLLTPTDRDAPRPVRRADRTPSPAGPPRSATPVPGQAGELTRRRVVDLGRTGSAACPRR